MQQLIPPLIELAAKYRTGIEGVRVNSLKRPDVNGPQFRIAARPMKRVHSAGPTEIVLRDVLVECVETHAVQWRKQPEFGVGHAHNDGPFLPADSAIADYGVVEIEGCGESNRSAMARTFEFPLHLDRTLADQ